MPRVTRRSSTQEAAPVEVNISSGEEEDVEIKDEDVKEDKKIPSTSKNQPQSQFVMIVPDELKNQSQFSMVKLRHPRTSLGCLFAFSQDDSSVYEVNEFDDGKRSWFVGDSVQSNGSLFLTSKVDPLFLIVAYLHKAKHASPLDQLVVDEDFPDTPRLCSTVKKERLELIADCKEAGSFQAWKLNEKKVNVWLENKVQKLSSHLKETNFNVTQSAVASNYVKSTATEVPDSTYKRYAFGIISEYLSEELSTQLEKHLDLPPVVKTCLDEGVKEPPAKRQKTGDKVLEPTEDYSKDVKLQPAKDKSVASAKEKALANAAKGSRSIASFFGKK